MRWATRRGWGGGRVDRFGKWGTAEGTCLERSFLSLIVTKTSYLKHRTQNIVLRISSSGYLTLILGPIVRRPEGLGRSFYGNLLSFPRTPPHRAPAHLGDSLVRISGLM